MSVIQFPERRRQQVQEEKLDSMIDTLNELYDNLEKVYQIVHRLEEETTLIEKNYNEEFRTYVGLVEDHEQVEIQYLNYSTEAEIYEDSENNLRIRLRGYEDENQETPL